MEKRLAIVIAVEKYDGYAHSHRQVCRGRSGGFAKALEIGGSLDKVFLRITEAIGGIPRRRFQRSVQTASLWPRRLLAEISAFGLREHASSPLRVTTGLLPGDRKRLGVRSASQDEHLRNSQRSEQYREGSPAAK